jgi:hypothetical protein
VADKIQQKRARARRIRRHLLVTKWMRKASAAAAAARARPCQRDHVETETASVLNRVTIWYRRDRESDEHWWQPGAREDDFERINELLKEIVDAVQSGVRGSLDRARLDRVTLARDVLAGVHRPVSTLARQGRMVAAIEDFMRKRVDPIFKHPDVDELRRTLVIDHDPSFAALSVDELSRIVDAASLDARGAGGTKGPRAVAVDLMVLVGAFGVRRHLSSAERKRLIASISNDHRAYHDRTLKRRRGFYLQRFELEVEDWRRTGAYLAPAAREPLRRYVRETLAIWYPAGRGNRFPSCPRSDVLDSNDIAEGLADVSGLSEAEVAMAGAIVRHAANIRDYLIEYDRAFDAVPLEDFIDMLADLQDDHSALATAAAQLAIRAGALEMSKRSIPDGAQELLRGLESLRVVAPSEESETDEGT